MDDLIKRLPEQFTWQPELVVGNGLPPYRQVVVVGMGGSHLPASLLSAAMPELPLLIHRDYGLPVLPGGLVDWGETRLILCSYSGNTEEVLEAARVAGERNLVPIVIASGGELWRLAEKENWPRVALPKNWPPRLALGFGLRALARALELPALAQELAASVEGVDVAAVQAAGKDLAAALTDRIPVIYASRANWPLAYVWKITLNETGKVPAFFNVLPEANHNELEGWGGGGRFVFVFLEGESESSPIKRRFAVLAEQLSGVGLAVYRQSLAPGSFWRQFLLSVLLANWTAHHLALAAGHESAAVPLIEEFKRKLSQS